MSGVIAARERMKREREKGPEDAGEWKSREMKDNFIVSTILFFF